MRFYVDDLTTWVTGRPEQVEAAVVAALQTTEAFAKDHSWKLNTKKGTIFCNCADLRARLRVWQRNTCRDLPVADHCRDLGLQQQVGQAQRLPTDKKRIDEALIRFRKVGQLPLPFLDKCRVAATAAAAAAAYGAALGGAGRTLLTTLRAEAKRSLCQGGQRAAAEIVFGLHSQSWRTDPAAHQCLAPLIMLAKTMRQRTWCRTRWMQAEAGGRLYGVVAAVHRSMEQLGLAGQVDAWQQGSTGTTWRPADAPLTATRHFLCEAWRQTQVRALAARRPVFQHLQGGIDIHGSKQALRELRPDMAGALRSVQAGNVVVEAVAAKWNGGSGTCPHCGTEPEDASHRFWRCPKWERQRTAAVQEAGNVLEDIQELHRRNPHGAMVTGLMARDTDLHNLAVEAAKVPLPAWPVLMPADAIDVCTDGSCLHPRDPLLARAGWGFVQLDSDGGVVHSIAGPIGGRQTAQRAEAAAVLHALVHYCQPLRVVTDSKYVTTQLASLAAGEDPLQWEHADIWQQLRPGVVQGYVQWKWIKAHLEDGEYAKHGITEAEWRGNALADKLAGQAARERLPPAHMLQRHARALADHRLVQHVLARVQHAVLCSDHGHGHTRPPRVARRWAAVRRGLRSKPTAAPPAAGSGDHSLAQEAPGYPPGLHQLVRSAGTLQCTACLRSAGAGRWHTLAYTPCPVGQPGWQWRRVAHEVVQEGAHLTCTRCTGRIATRRGRAAMCGRLCPAWLAVPPAELATDAVHGKDWGVQVARLLGVRVAGRRPGVSARDQLEDTSAAPPVPATPMAGDDASRAQTPMGAGGFLRWHPHVALQGAGFVACLQCGFTGATWDGLARRPCGTAARRLPPRVRAALLVQPAVRAGGCPLAFAAALALRLGQASGPPPG